MEEGEGEREAAGLASGPPLPPGAWAYQGGGARHDAEVLQQRQGRRGTGGLFASVRSQTKERYTGVQRGGGS